MSYEYRGPAATAHGAGYWLFIGWWWAPLTWLGRVALWVFLLPVGIWRTVRHSRKQREARERRGWQPVSQPPPYAAPPPPDTDR